MSSARNVKKVENSRRVGKARSGYNKGTIRGDLRYLVVSKDVRRHRLISIDYVTTLRCHGRGREFESRRPRHFFSKYMRVSSRKDPDLPPALATRSKYRFTGYRPIPWAERS